MCSLFTVYMDVKWGDVGWRFLRFEVVGAGLICIVSSYLEAD